MVDDKVSSTRHVLAVTSDDAWARVPLRLAACAVLVLDDETLGRATLQQVCVPADSAAQGCEEQVLAAAEAAAVSEGQQWLDVRLDGGGTGGGTGGDTEGGGGGGGGGAMGAALRARGATAASGAPGWMSVELVRVRVRVRVRANPNPN